MVAKQPVSFIVFEALFPKSVACNHVPVIYLPSKLPVNVPPVTGKAPTSLAVKVISELNGLLFTVRDVGTALTSDAESVISAFNCLLLTFLVAGTALTSEAVNVTAPVLPFTDLTGATREGGDCTN